MGAGAIIGILAGILLVGLGAIWVVMRRSGRNDEPEAASDLEIPAQASRDEAPPPAPAPAPARRKAAAEPEEGGASETRPAFGEMEDAREEQDQTEAPAPSPAADSPVSEAACTVFAPPSVAAEERFLIQVWLHRPAAASRVRELAAMADETTAERPAITLSSGLAEGQTEEIRVEAPELAVDEPVQQVVWNGDAATAYVTARAPADLIGKAAFARIRVFVGAAPLGSGVLRLAVHPAAGGLGGVLEVGARRYRTAFLSYAREDLQTVLEHHQALAAVGLDVVQDILTLSPGERWERMLYAHIDRCDVFLLYWSRAAAASEAVIKEAEWALNRQRTSGDNTPDIIPVVLESPPPAPPEALAHLHFDDPVRRLIISGL